VARRAGARGTASSEGRALFRHLSSTAAIVAPTAAIIGLVLPGSGAPASATLLGSTAATAPVVAVDAQAALPGRYVVVLRAKPAGRSTAPVAATITRARERGVRVDRQYGHALTGFAAALSADQLAAVRHDPDVSYVIPDTVMSVDGVQSPAGSWGQDRVDQRNLPLNNFYMDKRQRRRGDRVRDRQRHSRDAHGIRRPGLRWRRSRR
jgi:hypothetical protein